MVFIFCLFIMFVIVIIANRRTTFEVPAIPSRKGQVCRTYLVGVLGYIYRRGAVTF